MQAGAGEADEGAEFGGGPLRGRGGAVAASGVTGEFLEGEELDGRVSVGERDQWVSGVCVYACKRTCVCVDLGWGEMGGRKGGRAPWTWFLGRLPTW